MSDTPPGHKTRTEQLLTNTATMKTRTTHTKMEIRYQYPGQPMEIVDEYPNTPAGREEARRVLEEYRISDKSGRYSLRRTPCSEAEALGLMEDHKPHSSNENK